jgi:hypothetical protein
VTVRVQRRGGDEKHPLLLDEFPQLRREAFVGLAHRAHSLFRDIVWRQSAGNVIIIAT